MLRFIKGAGSVLLAIALALTWSWTGWLKDSGYLNDRQRLSILVCLTALLAVQQIYLVLPTPEKRGAVEERRAINENYLKLFCVKYYETLKVITGGGGAPPIRVNIMLPTRKVKGLLGSYLRIYYYAVPAGKPYSNTELSLRWRMKEGTCGWAWKYGISSTFDSADPNLRLSDQRIDAAKKSIVKDVQSVLSVPIWHGGKIVGVFSLDSEKNVDQTRFHDSEIFTLAVAFANNLGAQCYSDGVEG